MKTIGELIKEKRTVKKYSQKDLAAVTKIKSEFIDSLEKLQWHKLPEYPVVTGFVKNIADALKLERGKALALLRRDYPPQNLPINPKPDVTTRFSWSPKLTFFLGIGVGFFVVLAYLVYQFYIFIQPPPLRIVLPIDGQTVTERNLRVSGTTDPSAVVKVNNQPVIVDEEGTFATEIEIFEGTMEIIITSQSRSGKETIVVRKIVPELSN